VNISLGHLCRIYRSLFSVWNKRQKLNTHTQTHTFNGDSPAVVVVSESTDVPVPLTDMEALLDLPARCEHIPATSGQEVYPVNKTAHTITQPWYMGI
jgi:hypothetical protein